MDTGRAGGLRVWIQELRVYKKLRAVGFFNLRGGGGV